MTTFQKRLKARRTELNMTQTDLAREANVTPASISQYESGVREPHWDNLIDLTEALDCSADYLLGRIDTLRWDTSFIENDPRLKEMADSMLAADQESINTVSEFAAFMLYERAH